MKFSDLRLLDVGNTLQMVGALKVSKGLTPEVRAANEAVLATLAAIPRVQHVKSR